METQELHRGRLIDHIQLVVRDLPASQAFYTAVFKALQVAMGGTGEGYFWGSFRIFAIAAADLASTTTFGRATISPNQFETSGLGIQRTSVLGRF